MIQVVNCSTIWRKKENEDNFFLFFFLELKVQIIANGSFRVDWMRVSISRFRNVAKWTHRMSMQPKSEAVHRHGHLLCTHFELYIWTCFSVEFRFWTFRGEKSEMFQVEHFEIGWELNTKLKRLNCTLCIALHAGNKCSVEMCFIVHIPKLTMCLRFQMIKAMFDSWNIMLVLRLHWNGVR